MKIKKIIGCTIAILAIGTIGVGVWHGVKYKDKPNDLGGVEQPKPDNPEKPDTPDAPLVHKVIFQIGDITEEQNIAHGSYANIVFPTTIEGKRVIGWYIGEEKIDVANYSIMEDTIFTAKFEDIVYVVTIEIDGETKTQTVNHGEYLNFEEPTKEGYTYLGLSLDGVNITDLTTYPITQDLTLIALFEPSVTSASLFTFDGDTITGYDGQESVVVIPTTYSLGELKTTTREFADSLELEDYMSDNDLLELEIIDANNEKSTIYFYQTSELAYPVTAEVKIQTYIDGTDFTVTKLSHTIFEGNTTLTEVVVPEGITTFGNNIFKNCSNLVSVSLPESLLDLGGSTFSGCSNLTKVNIPNGINLLNRIISHPKTKTAMMSLISNTLNDKLIFNSLVTYTNKIIIDILQDKKIQSLIQTNLQLSLQNTHLKQEFVGLVQYILNQERTKQITRNYFLEMFNKCDIQNSFTNLILQSTLRTMKHKETKSNFSNFIIETWADPNLRWNVLMKTFQFWKPNRKEAKH